MAWLRRLHVRAVDAAIARRVEGLCPVPFAELALAPRICPRCRGSGRRARGAVCATCGGQGCTCRFLADDPSHGVLVSGPSDLGIQRLLAVALADGRVALVHVSGSDPLPRACYLCAAAHPARTRRRRPGGVPVAEAPPSARQRAARRWGRGPALPEPGQVGPPGRGMPAAGHGGAVEGSSARPPRPA
jgi:hypothetical protein